MNRHRRAIEQHDVSVVVRGNPTGLRQAIDSGRTGDKVSASDPSAAPLGTDDEAAGRPPSPREIDLAMAQEVTARSAMVRHRAGVRAALVVAAAVLASLGLLIAAFG